MSSFISSIRTRYLGWSHSTPLPDLPDAGPPIFQAWHLFDKSTCNWAQVQTSSLNAPSRSRTSTSRSKAPSLRLLTWNIDAFGARHESRMEGILSRLQQMHANSRGPDVVFFQEVSRQALTYLLQHAWVREHWISSEADETNWVGVPFATITLLSQSRFGVNRGTSDIMPQAFLQTPAAASSQSFSLGSIWRVKYPSRFGRDALCCDVFWHETTRIRLINVHLDSLPIQPNQRPRQVAIAASLVHTVGVGRGFIAGDWNPVSEEDKTLVQKNNLTDAWESLRSGEDGFTWGLDGKGDPFPPARLDKIAVLGLNIKNIEVVHPEALQEVVEVIRESRANNEKEPVPWSDHSGVLCDLELYL